MPVYIMVNGDHLINEYWECPQLEKICILKMKFNDQNIPEVVNCFSEKSAKSLQTFSESNMIVRPIYYHGWYEKYHTRADSVLTSD